MTLQEEAGRILHLLTQRWVATSIEHSILTLDCGSIEECR